MGEARKHSQAENIKLKEKIKKLEDIVSELVNRMEKVEECVGIRFSISNLDRSCLDIPCFNIDWDS